jgi:type I restriction enzyme, S subunit
MSWRTCRLGDVMTLKRGHDLPEHSRQEGDVPVVSSSGITGRHKEAKATAPGVVTGRYGTIGEVYFLQEDFWPLNTALYVIDFKGNDPRFASYFLRNVLKGYQSEKAAIPGVDRNVLHEIKVQLPSLPEQLRITEILSTYDDLIDNNRRRMALLEDSARQLYREWFVRLRFPGHEHTPIVDGMPQGWTSGLINDLVDVQSGYAFKTGTYESSGDFGLVTIKNVQDGFFDTECNSFIVEPPKQMPNHCHLKTTDILLSLTGNIGRICHVIGDSYLLNQRVAKLVPINDVPPAFCYFMFRSDEIKGQLNAISYGVAQQNLSPVNMGTLPVSIPPQSLLRMFNDVAEPLVQQSITLKLKNQKLCQARDLLLPRLMNGELAV